MVRRISWRGFGTSGSGLGRRAFITDIIVDFWAYIVFVLVVIVFAIFYAYTADARLQALEDAQDISYGNYLAQVYLRKPVSVGNTDMTVAELIALYDYNQTFERERDRSAWEEIEDFTTSFFHGTKNPMRDALMDITDRFVDAYFDDDKCYSFAITGNAFDYHEFSDKCLTIEIGGNFLFMTADVRNILDRLPSLPNSSYQTYISPVDPRDDPIIIHAVYDMDRLLDVYGKD
ncbi:hypothetical protein JW898_01235 [Candidatus Woesearchaeota archaeon]|nr:hypothetical protein [Candidatus Woesearchaeota archaeon]